MDITEIEVQRDALALRLQIIIASDLPQRVKTMRIHALTREIIALKEQIIAATAAENEKQNG
jgi:hypothetical protein